MSYHRIHRRADAALHARQVLAPVASPSSTVSTAATSTTRPLPAAAYTTSVPPHGVPPASTTSTSTSSVSSSSSSSSDSSASSSSAPSAASTIAAVAQSASDANVTTRPTASASVVANTTLRSTTTRSVATATNTSTDSDGMGVGSIAGIAVAAIVGIAVISAFVVWLIRRKKKNQDIDEEPFNRNSFMRNSTVIPDDDVGVPSRTRPQPNMVERQPTYGAPPPAFTDPGYNSFGYNTQPSYGAPQQGYSPNPFGPGGAPATPLPHSPGFGNTYDQGFNQAGYTELTRGGPHDYPPSPHTFDQQMPHPQSPSFPASPAPVTNYPELSPAPASSQGHVVVANGNVHETPAQPGFAPAQTRQANGTPAAPGQQGKGQGRPDTVYDPEDAYGGM